jgi:hypothetical protein
MKNKKNVFDTFFKILYSDMNVTRYYFSKIIPYFYKIPEICIFFLRTYSYHIETIRIPKNI